MLTPRAAMALAGFLVLAAVWAMPATKFIGPFSHHMTSHMLLVTVAAPLLALSIAGTRIDPAARWPALLSPVPASLVELAVVWGWHTPALHLAAQHRLDMFLLEQTSFLGAGAALWLSIVGGSGSLSPSRSAAGMIALVLTFAHMTLLGALLSLAPRPLYAHDAASGAPLSGSGAHLFDQQLGGSIMLVLSAATYLPACLWLGHSLLSRSRRGAIA